jgi:hypothetical protein
MVSLFDATRALESGAHRAQLRRSWAGWKRTEDRDYISAEELI